MLLLLIAGCSTPTATIEGLIGNVNQNSIEVDCTDAVNRDKKRYIPSIGYFCNVNVTEDTLIIDNKGKSITIEDLQQGQTVNVILKEKADISLNKRVVTATEIKVIK
ncbi:hypothetical protein MTP04_26180 [Lysinibacillus sp. PLM2]|nr:hypothetical protein MTP04_26180 [Lysinibacillus sp. PLM2]